MRRMIAAAILVTATLLAATPADAFWHHHWGRCGWGGYRGYGWGGYGWGGYGGYGGFGYRGYGLGYPGYGYGGFGYSGYGYPGYSVGYYPSYYSSYSPGYVCSNYGGTGIGTTVGLGYPGYGLYASASPSTNIIVAARPAASPLVVKAPAVAAAKPAMPLALASANVAPGALALQKFLGLKDIRPLDLNQAPAAVAARPISPPAKTFGDVLARFSNVESRRKADRLIAEGDELFRAQNFHSALQKYKLAASTAPDLAEALWRQGHALIATHNYDLATTAFKRAIAHTDDLGRNGFQLNDLYGGAAMTKGQHLESLAEWAVNRRNSSDPYFLLGLFLNYDGQPARAEKFFQKASDLAGISGGHIAVFLAPADDVVKPRPQGTARPAAEIPVVPISAGVEL
jgi:hypothetical protein